MHIDTGRAKLVVVLVVVAALGLSGLSFLLPVASTVQNPLAAHLRTAIAVIAATLTTAAAFWFLRGLDSFKAGSRHAYVLISIGLIVFSIALLQVPIIGLFDLWKSVWTSSGAALLPFIVPLVLVYFGLRTFARLLQITTRLTIFWLVLLVAIGLVVLTLVAGPAFIQVDNAKTVAVSLAVIIWGVTFSGACALLVRKVKLAIGEYYMTAMGYLQVAMAALTLSGMHEYIASLFLTNGDTYADYGFYIWPWVVSGALMLAASYQFRLLTLASSPGNQASSIATDKDYVDSIIAVAQLTSSPKDIDDILDDLRMLTSTAGPGRQFNADEKQRLLDVYRRLEVYFVRNADPLRTFTRDQLRQYVTPAFRKLLVS